MRGDPEDGEQRRQSWTAGRTRRARVDGGRSREAVATGAGVARRAGRSRGSPTPPVPRTRKRPKELVGGPASRLRSAPNKSGVAAVAARDPRSPALRPSNPAPGTAPRIAPRCRSGGSHLPLRARRNVPAGPHRRTTALSTNWAGMASTYPRVSARCGRHVDKRTAATRMQHPRPAVGVDFDGR